MKSNTIAIALSISLLSTAAMADDGNHKESHLSYTGPVELISISQLDKNTRLFKDEDVIMEGYIIRQIRRDEFIFSDGDEEIEIELEDDIQLQSINDTQKVRIYGEYEDGRTPRVEVDHIQLL